MFTDNKTDLFFFRSIALWAIPYHPCSSSPPSVANNRATDLGSYNKCECACGGAYVCVQIFVANFCIMYMQLAHMCISTELLQMRLHLYVTSYLTKCDGSLPPLQLWGSSALNKWIFSIAFNLPIGWLITWSIDWLRHPNVSRWLTDWVINRPTGEPSNIELMRIAKRDFVIL